MPPADVSLESLTSEIERLQKLIREKGVVYNEVNTRRALVDPLLKALGWSDHSIYSEYTVNYSSSFYGEAKRKVDYALHEPGDRGALIAFIEAKRVSNDLSDEHRTQIHNYARERDVQRYVLTNGDQWELYEKGASTPITLSIGKLSASECARLLLEHFPRLPKLETAQIVDPPKAPMSTMPESDALSSTPAIPSHPTSALPSKLVFAKPIAWFAVCLSSFGVVGWITGVVAARPNQSIFVYIGLFGVAVIVFLGILLVQRFFPSLLPVTMKSLVSTLSLSPTTSGTTTAKTRNWVVLAMICGAVGGGILGHFIGLWTAQPVANFLDVLGAFTLVLGAIVVGVAAGTYCWKKSANR